MAFTEFYVQTTGNNVSAGSTATDAAAYTAVNGSWDGVSIYTPTDGSTPASSVNVGDFCSVYIDGATVAVYVARVTAVAAGVNGAITLSTTAIAGTAPTVSATARSIKAGGAWSGPSGAVGHPFNFIASTLTDSAGDLPRVNWKAATYSITAAITHSKTSVTFQGYTSAVGDGGKATIDGGTTGASYLLLTVSGALNVLEDLTLQNNGATGTIGGVTATGAATVWRRCIFASVRGTGFLLNSAGTAIECEAFSCNQSNTGNSAGITLNDRGSYALRCYSHNNVGTQSSGFVMGVGGTMVDCISDTNGQVGYLLNGNTASFFLAGCDSYNNVSHGISFGSATSNQTIYIENGSHCNNGGYGISGVGTGTKGGQIVNVAFGSGTAANTSGQTAALSGVRLVNTVTLASNVTPWNSPSTGDFSIVLPAVKAAGRGSFTQTGNSKSGTVAYPDIGAAQSKGSPGGFVPGVLVPRPHPALFQ